MSDGLRSAKSQAWYIKMEEENMMNIRMSERVEGIVNRMCEEIKRLKRKGLPVESQKLEGLRDMYKMNKQFTPEFDFTLYDQRIINVMGKEIK